MKSKRIFVFLGHPNNESFDSALVDAYVRGAKAAGHDVRVTKISDMKFDPILHKGYKVIQPYEPDLLKFQEDVKWCEHFVSIYPVWWSSMPALMKGLIERVWMPGFAFNFYKGIIPGWYRRLKGRSARVIVTSDSHRLAIRILFGTNINAYTRAILRFSGFAPMKKTWFWGMKTLKKEQAEKMLAKVERLGKKGK